MRDWLGAGDSQYWDDAVHSVCSTQFMLYLVYAILCVYSESWHWEIERDDLTLSSEVMVEWEMGKWVMRGDGTYHLNKLTVMRLTYIGQYTIPDKATASLNSTCHIIDMRSFKLRQASHTPDFSKPLVSSTVYVTPSPTSLFLVKDCTIIAEHIVE
jgi:hypothetical protein